RPMRVSEVATVVLAGSGGARLGSTLASVAWGGERIVLDPAARLTRESLPRGVRLHPGAAEPAGLTTAPWGLLLDADERWSPGVAGAIGAVVAEKSAFSAYRIPLDVQGYGAALRPLRSPVRLARRAEARLRTGRGLVVELGPSSGRPGRLAAP